jgi:phage gpG-like protein
MGVEWYGDELMNRYEKKLADRLNKSASVWRRTAVANMGTPNNGGANPSVPGEYPHKVTGHLRRNINKVLDRQRMVALVGTNVIYGKYLQEGTKHMLPRPWIDLTNEKTRATIARIMRQQL